MKTLIASYSLAGEAYIDHTTDKDSLLRIELDSAPLSGLALYPLIGGEELVTDGLLLHANISGYVSGGNVISYTDSDTSRVSLFGRASPPEYVSGTGQITVVWNDVVFVATHNTLASDSDLPPDAYLNYGIAGRYQDMPPLPPTVYSGFRIRRESGNLTTGTIRIYKDD